MRNPPVRLGLGRTMPPGYLIVQLDSGHYLWTMDDVLESAIHWDKWAIYRSAWAHYRERCPPAVLAEAKPTRPITSVPSPVRGDNANG